MAQAFVKGPPPWQSPETKVCDSFDACKVQSVLYAHTVRMVTLAKVAGDRGHSTDTAQWLGEVSRCLGGGFVLDCALKVEEY